MRSAVAACPVRKVAHSHGRDDTVGCIPDRIPDRILGRILGGVLGGVLSFTVGLADAHAFDTLTAPQMLIYDRAHLLTTEDGDELHYRYLSTRLSGGVIRGAVSLRITQDAADDQRRNVAVNFLADEQHLPLPTFDGYRGNPVIIAMLEHVVRQLGAITGGGVVYFRNRIRDALAADSLEVQRGRQQFGTEKIDIDTLEFQPFANDPYLARWPELSVATIVIRLSDDVPGSVVEIGIAPPAGSARDAQQFAAALTFTEQ